MEIIHFPLRPLLIRKHAFNLIIVIFIQLDIQKRLTWMQLSNFVVGGLSCLHVSYIQPKNIMRNCSNFTIVIELRIRCGVSFVLFNLITVLFIQLHVQIQTHMNATFRFCRVWIILFTCIIRRTKEFHVKLLQLYYYDCANNYMQGGHNTVSFYFRKGTNT